MTPEEYRSHDALGLAELVARGEVEPRALVELAAGEIDRLNPRLNAVVHRLDARAQAAVQAGLPQGAFTGVPWLFKDQIDVEGTPMTLGSALLQGHVCNFTHPTLAKMEATGLVALGRTNMSELGLVPTTEPTAFGPTKNPHNLAHTVGGSSGGSAAAVAAGIVPIAHAVDGGGSIRIPAAACGLVGLKPGRGRNLPAEEDEPFGFVVQHCLSRSVRDSAALLDAVAEGPRPALSYLEHSRQDPKRLRVGFTARGVFDEPIHADARRAVEDTAAALEELGHAVEEVKSPVDGEAFGQAFRVLWAAGAGVFYKLARRGLSEADLPDWQRSLLKSPAAFRAAAALTGRVEPFTRRLAALDRRFSPSDLWLAGAAMRTTATLLADWFGGYDLFLSPVLTRPPLKIGELKLSGTDDEVARWLFQYIAFTPIANGTGLPAISVPAGRSAKGLPMGVQFIAAEGQEDLLLSVAGQLERARPWEKLAALA